MVFLPVGGARVHQGDCGVHLPVYLAYCSRLYPSQDYQLLLPVWIVLFYSGSSLPNTTSSFSHTMTSFPFVSYFKLTVWYFSPHRDSNGNSYDLSSLALDSRNWVVEPSTGKQERYYINVCRSLVQQGGKCLSSTPASFI